jgi:hypothetical protein
MAATLAGGVLQVLILAFAFTTAAALNAQPRESGQAVWLASVLYLAALFVAPALGALPQAVVVGRSAAQGRQSRRALGWIGAGALGGLLYIGYAMYDNTSRPTWSDVLGWYGLVTVAVSLLVVGAQAAVLRQVVPASRPRAYTLLTAAGWLVGWTFFLVYSGGSGGSGLWGLVGPYLWYGVPLALIGACSGFVLAPLLSTRASSGQPLPALAAER